MRTHLLSLLSFVVLGCGDPVPGRVPERRPVDHGTAPSHAPGRQVHDRGQRELARLTPAADFSGPMSAGEVREHPLVLLGTHCYAILGQSEGSDVELDLMLVGADGSVLVRDADTGPSSSLGVREQICPDTPGQYEVRIRVSKASSQVFVRLYQLQVI